MSETNEALLKGETSCEDTTPGSAARYAACLECCDPGARNEYSDWKADCANSLNPTFDCNYDAQKASEKCAPSSFCKSSIGECHGGKQRIASVGALVTKKRQAEEAVVPPGLM